MSTTWALMSTRPSSNTANSPAGPPPTISASVSMGAGLAVPSAAIERSLCFQVGSEGSVQKGSELLLGDADDEAVQLRGDANLARQPAGGAHVIGEIEHVLLHLTGRACLLLPGVIDKDVAGGAGAGAAAFGLDALDEVHLGRLHDGQARLAVDGLLRAVRLNERDPGHAPWRSTLGCYREPPGGRCIGVSEQGA